MFLNYRKKLECLGKAHICTRRTCKLQTKLIMLGFEPGSSCSEGTVKKKKKKKRHDHEALTWNFPSIKYSHNSSSGCGAEKHFPVMISPFVSTCNELTGVLNYFRHPCDFLHEHAQLTGTPGSCLQSEILLPSDLCVFKLEHQALAPVFTFFQLQLVFNCFCD